MKHFRKIVFVAFACAIASQMPANAAEELGAPPPEPAGTVLRPATNESIREELDERLVADFSAAAGSSPYLTAQQAKKAGWGFIADHFAEIDKSHAGYVTVNDIQAFMDARAPGDPVATRARANALKATIQKIE
jgi:hypothetical protein